MHKEVNVLDLIWLTRAQTMYQPHRLRESKYIIEVLTVIPAVNYVCDYCVHRVSRFKHVQGIHGLDE